MSLRRAAELLGGRRRGRGRGAGAAGSGAGAGAALGALGALTALGFGGALGLGAFFSRFGRDGMAIFGSSIFAAAGFLEGAFALVFAPFFLGGAAVGAGRNAWATKRMGEITPIPRIAGSTA